MSQLETDFDPKAYIKGLPNKPGVYRMLDASGNVIYVGKAVDLKKRVSSYFRANLDSPKTRVMVGQIAAIEVTVTHNESEALILENTQIKALRPRYNVLFRDDKSYPYIYLSTEHPFPRLTFHRGAKRGKGRYFGPYPSAPSVRETLSLLQKLFPVRQCRDSFYNNRSRPCLQYQIKRCTAPCVGLISEDEYAEDVRHATLFLEGKSSAVIDALAERMAQAAERLDYEAAARYRDQISSLRHIQDKQYMDSESGGNLDVIATAAEGGVGCVQIFTIRQGRNLGNRSYFPKQLDGLEPEQLESGMISSFLTQHYLSRQEDIPAQLIVSHPPEDLKLIESTLSEAAGRRVRIHHNVRGTRSRWLTMAIQNAHQSLNQRLNSQATQLQRFEALQEALQLEELPQRLECFDISHTLGEATVASCVVFDINGPLKSDYRRFNIEGITPGDDYAAMQQALTRRYKRLREGGGKLPDILFIDGGKGQVHTARNVLEELQVPGVRIIGIAKGPGRKPGLETLYLSDGGEDTILPADSKALHLVQQIRDEAHRFAITGHRQRRQKSRNTSTLEQIPGLGPKRRQSLLHRFGGLQEIARAGVEDLAAVNGISRKLAQQIYDTFHKDGY